MEEDLTPQERIMRIKARLDVDHANINAAAGVTAKAMQRFNIALRRTMEAAELSAVEEVHNLALARRARN